MIEVRTITGELEAVYADEQREAALGYVKTLLEGVCVRAVLVDERQIQEAGRLYVEQAIASDDYFRFFGDRPELYAIFADPVAKWAAVESRAKLAQAAVNAIEPAVRAAFFGRVRELAKKREG